MGIRKARRLTREVLDSTQSREPVRISERRTLHPGDVCKIRGVRGEFTYQYQYPNGDLTFYGGSRNPLGHRSTRSFTPDRVQTIKRST